ncbi:hypothetical protein LINPERHAP1_LOCUS49 [Linum perenne]
MDDSRSLQDGGLGSVSSLTDSLLPCAGADALGNLVGKTVKIDFNTQRAERGRFARIAIELDLNESLPPVALLDGAPPLVEYESLLNLCFECGRIGHDSTTCPKTLLAALPAPIAPQGDLAVNSGSDLVAPSPDHFGLWMLVSHRSNRPGKEGQTCKEGHNSKEDQGVNPGSDFLSKKQERRNGG